MKRIILAIAAAFFMLGIYASASAQYVWIDQNNKKHYSDQAPPASVPNSRILKTPRNQPAVNMSEAASNSAAAAGASAGAASAAKPQAPMTTAEKNADYNKRKSEQAEKDKKADEEKKRADDKAQNCQRAKDYKRTLDSGDRVTRTGKNGEREFFSDDDVRKEKSAVQDALKDCN